MSASKLLQTLDKVKQTGPGRWLACCPAHEDKSPSLSIRELDDGRVLIHDFAGCSVNQVLGAVGLDFDALYPEKPIEHGKPEKRPFPVADILRALAFEASIVLIAATDLLTGQPFTETDRERLALAASRIRAGLTAGGIGHA